MSGASVKYTLNIFKRLIIKTPPLIPVILKEDAKHAYEQLCHNYDLTLGDLEKTIIIFGKKLWPYRKAFEEFFNIYEGKFGEMFLLGILSPDLKNRYKEFKEYGGSFRDLYSGNPAEFFTKEERLLLCDAMIKINDDIHKYATQAVMTTDKVEYEKRIVEFQVVFDDIEKRLGTLRIMADSEQEHPDLAAEIRQQVLAFEYGLCLLGPPHHYDAICKAEEYYKGRKEDKQHF